MCLREEIIVCDRAELLRRADSAAEGLAILDFLDVAETRRAAAVAVGVVGVESHADASVTAGVHFALVEDGLHFAVHHLGRLAAVGVEEIAIFVGFVVRTVDIAVAKRGFEVAGNFAAPLGRGVLFGLLDRGAVLGDRREVLLPAPACGRRLEVASVRA